MKILLCFILFLLFLENSCLILSKKKIDKKSRFLSLSKKQKKNSIWRTFKIKKKKKARKLIKKKKLKKKRTDEKKERELMIPGMGGGDTEDFPPLPPGDEMPIIINSPPVNIPKSSSPFKDAGHIIFSPMIMYPDKKKRLIVHHNDSMQEYYQKMTSQLNPYYTAMANANPYYSQYLSNAPFYTNMMSNPTYAASLDKANEIVNSP